MERLILFAVAAIVWSVVKALSQSAPKPPPPRQTAPSPKGNEQDQKNLTPPRKNLYSAGTYFAEKPGEALEVEEIEEIAAIPQLELSGENLVQGIIFAEILSPPKGRRPHRTR